MQKNNPRHRASIKASIYIYIEREADFSVRNDRDIVELYGTFLSLEETFFVFAFSTIP
jgi:hypothetical protein